MNSYAGRDGVCLHGSDRVNGFRNKEEVADVWLGAQREGEGQRVAGWDRETECFGMYLGEMLTRVQLFFDD